MNILAVDIGGTTIKSDIYDEKGNSLNLFKEISTYVDFEKKTNEIVKQIFGLIELYQNNISLDGIAIATAGVVNSFTGEILYSGYTIPNYTSVNLKKRIQYKYDIPVSIENDVNCAALGETWIKKYQGSVFMITIGTGIGGAIIYNGNIFRGTNFAAGEVGYLPINKKCWQDIASASSLISLYEFMSGKKNQSGKTFCSDIDAKNPIALDVLDKYVDNLVTGMLFICYVINPSTFIIGGGIMARSTIFLPKIKEKLKKNIIDDFFLPEHILSANLGNEAGRLGAVKVFLNEYGDLVN